MKPEKESRKLLSITRSKAKMYEFSIPEEYHIDIQEDPVKLFTLAIGLLGELSARTNSNNLDPDALSELRKSLLFSAGFFDAYLQSRLLDDYKPYLLLLGSASYYLCDLPGSSIVLAKGINGELTDLDSLGLGSLLHWLLRRDFTNPIDSPDGLYGEAIQGVSNLPLALRQVPIREDENITGYVDLVSERAYKYKPGEPSDLIPIPDDMAERKEGARTVLLETIADFNDDILEQLLEDIIPEKTAVYQDLAKDLTEGLVVPVLLGAGEQNSGVTRLLKLLRHEVPQPAETAARHGIEAAGDTLAQVFKTSFMAHVGKMSLARVWRGTVKDGMTLNDDRISGLFHMQGQHSEKINSAGVGEVVAIGRMDEINTGDVLTPSGDSDVDLGWSEPVTPVYALAVEAQSRGDEVKLSSALTKLAEEDPSLAREQNSDTHELLLWGQGDMHLQVAFERLANKYNLLINKRSPQVAYKESIRKAVSQHARFKHQTGGHGQFGDVHLDIKPLPRGSGFNFEQTITGGAVPRQYIPAVEAGVKDFLSRGPLGFPTVDIAVTLTDGAFHAVDSSEQAFKQAARLAMTEGMAKCAPVLLEPIFVVRISAPSEFTSKVQRLISGRRGQFLGFDAKLGWKGWDEISANMPQSEIQDLINELRSLTVGVGTFTYEFDHLQEFTGREAEQVVENRQAEATQQ